MLHQEEGPVGKAGGPWELPEAPAQLRCIVSLVYIHQIFLSSSQSKAKTQSSVTLLLRTFSGSLLPLGRVQTVIELTRS